MSSGTDFGAGGHRYNDDLLLAAETRERAQLEFENVFHLLDHPELRETFRRENDAANQSKKRAQVAGFWGVTSAFLALAGAASEPLWSDIRSPWPDLVAIASAMLGLLSILVSVAWLIFGKRKSAWLHARFFTERLRQFHFQSFVWRLPEIAESLHSSNQFQEQYRAKRKVWFDVFEYEMKGKADVHLSALLQPTAVPEIWLHKSAWSGEPPVVPDAPASDFFDVFRAYEVFRLDEQQGYAEYMTRLSNKPETREPGAVTTRQKLNWLWYPGINLPLKLKRTMLTTVWLLALVALVVMHIGVLGSHIAALHPWGKLAHVTIVWFALTAVAVKTLAEGFALTREIERYEEYRSVVSGLKQAFRAAESPKRKLEIMLEMEKASFEEMRVFLRSNYETTFIM